MQRTIREQVEFVLKARQAAQRVNAALATARERWELELFARRKREKWHAWGNQVDSDIVLTSRHESESGGADDGTQRQRPDRLSL